MSALHLLAPSPGHGVDEVTDESVEVIAYASHSVCYTVLGFHLVDGILQFSQGVAEPLDLGIAQPPPLDAADSGMDECLLDHLEEGDDERQQSLSKVVPFEVKHGRPRLPGTRLAVWPQASR